MRLGKAAVLDNMLVWMKFGSILLHDSSIIAAFIFQESVAAAGWRGGVWKWAEERRHREKLSAVEEWRRQM